MSQLTEKIVKIALVLGAFLLALLFYTMNQRARQADSDAAVQVSDGEAFEPAAPEAVPDPFAGWPERGLTVTEDEIGTLPEQVQELLADPGWNQPYIESGAVAREAGAGETRYVKGVVSTIQFTSGVEPIAEGKAYRVTEDAMVDPQTCTLDMRVGLAPQSAPRVIDLVIWALRNGVITVQPVDGAASAQTSATYSTGGHGESLYVVRAMVVLDDGSRWFADSLPVRIESK